MADLNDTIGDARMERARAHVAALKGFYIHTAVFAAVIVVLIAIDAATAEGWWVQWPLIGWGLGLGLHAFLVFADAPKSLRAWEERKIREYAEAERRAGSKPE